MGAKEAALPVQEVQRSDVVGANVLQVVELKLQLAYSHILGSQLVLQPPQLLLLPEEHPQELSKETKTETFVQQHRIICKNFTQNLKSTAQK